MVKAIPPHKRIADARAGIERLAIATRSSTVLAPGLAALDSMIAQADAVARALRELRPVIVAEIGPNPPRAA